MKTNVPPHKQKAAAKVDDTHLEEPSPPVLIDKKRSSDHVGKIISIKPGCEDNDLLNDSCANIIGGEEDEQENDLEQQPELISKMAPDQSVARLAEGKETKFGLLKNNETIPSSSCNDMANHDDEMHGLKPDLEVVFPEAFSAADTGKVEVAHDVTTKNKGANKDKQEPSKKTRAPHESFDEITKEGPEFVPETTNDRFRTSKDNEMNLKMPHDPFLEHHIKDNDKMTREGPELVAATKPNFHTNPKKNVPKMAKGINMDKKNPRFTHFTNHKDKTLSGATEGKNGNEKGQKQGRASLFSSQHVKGLPSSMSNQLDLVSVDGPVPISKTARKSGNAIAERNRKSRERRKMGHQNDEDLYDEGLPSSIPPNDANSAPSLSMPSKSDEMKVEEGEEITNCTDNDESQKPGAFAVAGIGADNTSNVWESTLCMVDNREASTVPPNDQHDINGSEKLISAIVVDNDAIPEAEAVSEEVLKRNKRRRALGCLLALALIIVTIVLAVVLTRDTSTMDISQSPSQSQVPSTSPSLLPSSSPTSSIRLFLEDISPLSIEAFEDETSPQFKALRWLESNHTNLFETYTDDRIIQRFALATLYYSTQGEQWIQSNDWLNSTQHECDWFSSHQHDFDWSRCYDGTYDELKLTSNRLQGALPREIYLLSNLLILDLSDNVLRGILPSELGLLKNIKTINLNGNSLDGSLPTELVDLDTTLTQLDLSSNTIEGKIPSVLGLLTVLESLRINYNLLSGAIFSEIGMLSNLKTLSLMGNNLDGTIPLQVASMQKLEIFDLNDNLLSGAISLSINQSSTQPLAPILPKLKKLSVGSNFITSTLPSQIGLISNLELLDMRSNRLQSTIPSEIGQLVRLDALDLSGNLDFYGTLPTELGLIIQLESLHIFDNDLSGTIPETIGSLVNLRSLDVSRNSLSGTIPETLGSLVNLEYIKLDWNVLGGTISETIGSLVNLVSLDLIYNSLSGTIPETISSLVNLESLRVFFNFLSGTIPETIGSLVNLKSLDLSDNILSGTIPETIGSLVNLETLLILQNGLSGTIPESVGSLVNLQSFIIFENHISGSIPESIGSLLNLGTLTLRSNRLSGAIPETIGSLVLLELLDLSSNSASGTIPETIGSLVNLKSLNLSSNDLSGKIPETIGSLVNMKSLKLLCNRLSGTIPETIGSLVSLLSLDLSFNGLGGTIPEIIGSVVNLEYIKLDYNILSGTIPETLGSLVHLELLDLQENILSGEIPENFGSLVNLESLNLIFNHLSGTIPETVGSLVNLQSLRIFQNRLSGTIPETIGSLVNLESLDLSANRLSGTIPETLGSLVNLDVLWIAFNDLTGEVPNGICELRRTNYMSNFLIDCEEIACDCCFDFCSNPPRITNSTSSTLNCTDGMALLQVAIGIDQDGEGVTWDVVDESTNTNLLQGGPLTQDYRWNTIIEETCASNDACLLFTIRGSNSDGDFSDFIDNVGDRFMVHLNGSEISNGRFQDVQEDERFFFGATSSCVATDRLQACSVTHPTCDNTGLECHLDNTGGVSGFCNPPAPSLAPSTSPAPSMSPSTSQAPSISPAPSFSPSSNPSYTPSTSSNPTFTQCDNGLSALVIELTTDDYPEETSWELTDTGDVILQGGDYTDKYTTHVKQTCISNESCLRFTIYDSLGNGLFEGGGYVIYVNNRQVASGGGDFGFFETLGSCSDTAFPSLSPSLSPTAMPTTNLTAVVDDNNNNNNDDDEPLSPPCQDGMVKFTIETEIENNHGRIAWTVVNRNSGSTPSGDGGNDDSILLQGGPYKENDIMDASVGGTATTQSTCVVSDACLVLEIRNVEEAALSNNNELLFGSVDRERVFASFSLYANGNKIAVVPFWGSTIITEVGAC